ncbi:MAG TPA: RNA chaperone Hfq [Terriglobales bacterium]|jgi:host factor-I protein
MPFQRRDNSSSSQKPKSAPQDETFQEAIYLKSLGEKQKQVKIKLQGGEVVEGWVEYYDKHMLRLTRDTKPNLFIFKHDIVYIAEE